MGDRRVIIIQPYVPKYRVPLFDALDSRLADLNMTLVVVSGQSSPRLDGRKDAARGPWSESVPARSLGQRDRGIRWRDLSSLEITSRDIVIVEQSVRNLDTYGLLGRPRSRRPRIAFWGHGRTYSLPHSPLREWLKRRVTRRGDWFFAYTDGAAQDVAHGGYPCDRISVLRNTIDAEALREDLAHVDDGELHDLRTSLRLTPGRTGLFLGGVDSAKGIDFLVASAVAVREQLPDFVLLVGGEGEDMDRLRTLIADDGPIRLLGRLDGRHKARILAVSDIMLIPQWIGLVAVDSLVAGRPIVSTRHPSHSVEREYLVDGVTAVFTDATVRDYAEGIVRLLEEPERRQAMQEACVTASADFSIDAMADSFVRGILAMTEADR